MLENRVVGIILKQKKQNTFCFAPSQKSKVKILSRAIENQFLIGVLNISVDT